MFKVPVRSAPNFLTLTIITSNQILHTARYFDIFKDWEGQRLYNLSELTTFYKDFSDSSEVQLQALDDEVLEIAHAISSRAKHINLSEIVPLRERLCRQFTSVQDGSSLKSAITSNAGLRDVPLPVKQLVGGVVPAVESRLFWEDIPYGLCVLKDLAEKVQVATPEIEKLIL